MSHSSVGSHKTFASLLAVTVFLCGTALAQDVPPAPTDDDTQGDARGAALSSDLNEPRPIVVSEVKGWEGILHESLWLHYQGKYQDVFNLVQGALRSREPGPEVHRCLAMMRRAFIDFTKTEEPVHNWNGEAKTYIEKLDEKKGKGIEDIVTLCVLKPLEQSMEWATEPLLDRIVESESPWRDWAYWEKARVVGLKASGSAHVLGLADYNHNGRRYPTCSTEMPREAIAGRAAIAFLEENPKTYMRDAFLADFVRWRVLQARRAVYYLKREQELLGYPLNDEQLKALKTVEQVFVSSWQRESNLKLQLLGDNLNRHLWGDFYRGNVKNLLIEYLKAVAEAKGKEALPSEIYEAIMALPQY